MFVHRIDPILFDAGGLHFWWYGLSYALGFLEIHLWFMRARRRLGLTVSQVYTFSILFAASVLFFGRMIEVVFYEWPYYRHHLWQVPGLWLGGMCTHGILVGAVAGTWLFCRLNGKCFLTIADELVIPGAFLMGVGRIGNFIDGQIVGRVTDLPWAVQFPDAEGFRHPVVLYDGVKNLLLIPLLLGVRKYSKPVPGKTMAHFVFWYGFLRFFVDIYREYPTRMFGIGTGQSFNIFMSVVGLILLAWFSRWHQGAPVEPPPAPPAVDALPPWAKRAVFTFLLAFSLIIPSDWTQDVPARYGKRHPGLAYSRLYPQVNSAPPARR
ncbi:MAG: prolipoprotein diacylglyceryl transferase [Verrucomicrobiota bacterium]